MQDTSESKRRYYEWHGADLVTLGEIRDQIDSGSVVLDLGCGSGWLATEIANLGVTSVVGVDIDDVVLELNQLKIASVSGIRAFSNNLPIATETFDVVVVKDLIEHLQFPADTIQEIYRVLKPGGTAYFSTPTPQGKSFYDDYTHVRPFTRKSLRSLLEDCGLQVEGMYYTGNYRGVGWYMRRFQRDRLPKLSRILAGARIGRNNIHAWARKPAVASDQR